MEVIKRNYHLIRLAAGRGHYGVSLLSSGTAYPNSDQIALLSQKEKALRRQYMAAPLASGVMARKRSFEVAQPSHSTWKGTPRLLDCQCREYLRGGIFPNPPRRLPAMRRETSLPSAIPCATWDRAHKSASLTLGMSRGGALQARGGGRRVPATGDREAGFTRRRPSVAGPRLQGDSKTVSAVAKRRDFWNRKLSCPPCRCSCAEFCR
jgi:hypothetical protein